jgi:hypothetical protein
MGEMQKSTSTPRQNFDRNSLQKDRWSTSQSLDLKMMWVCNVWRRMFPKESPGPNFTLHHVYRLIIIIESNTLRLIHLRRDGRCLNKKVKLQSSRRALARCRTRLNSLHSAFECPGNDIRRHIIKYADLASGKELLSSTISDRQDD